MRFGILVMQYYDFLVNKMQHQTPYMAGINPVTEFALEYCFFIAI